MPNSYAVQVIDSTQLGPELADRTVVYADTELEARISGASVLGVAPSRLTVTVIEATPSDADMLAKQEEIRLAQARMDTGPSPSY